MDYGSGAGGTVTAIAAPASAGGPASSPAATGEAPVQVLNELAQAGYVAGLATETGMDGAAHRPVFSCTVTSRAAGIATPVRVRDTGGSKAAAKASAATALLAGLAEDDPARD